ncbi:MAG: 1-deoxy-D-xylulose-5-phosphate synthase [Phascolarctobacterium sp.]|nr:1-deoxy-D-xylulose-5-phosphate synthase [Phascolarctobacterium sp.]
MSEYSLIKRKLIDNINSPEDIKKLTNEQIAQLASEIREMLIQVVSRNGGHLAPNLGVVELTLALHKVFSTPEDKIIFDVGHQSYIHKIITGRRKEFNTLRQYRGISGFPKISESKHDAFGTGHSSTSISAALGMAIARDLQHENYNVIAVIGDGSMTGGMAFEALDNAGNLHKKLIVVLNDNEMSISKNVGAMSKYLYRLRTGEIYTKIKGDFEGWLKSMDFGQDVLKFIQRVKGSVKYLMIPMSVFEELGFTYLGPIDGHDYNGMVKLFETAKRINGPVLIHVLTQKGRGYKPAEENPNKFHGTGPFEIATGKKIEMDNPPLTYTEVFGKTIIKMASADEKIVAITAAMPDGTGLTPFAEKYPERFFDVGIAEQHAVTAAAGMAVAGLNPVVAVYSTFLQRAYDSVLHDICMQNLHVTFCLDRAGLVGDDGCTHHGVFDYAYLHSMPNMTIMAPKDENELRHMLFTALDHDGPIALRYPRGYGLGVAIDEDIHTIPLGKAEVLKYGSDLSIWALGTMADMAVKVAEKLASDNISAAVVNMRFIKPIDKDLLLEHAAKYKTIAVIEEGVVLGGAGSAVLEIINDSKYIPKVYLFGIPDKFVGHGPREQLLKDIGMDADTIANKIKSEKLD